MKVVINALVFCIVLFIYLHVYFHLKTSDDLEVYEIDQPSKERLEEICDQRQPVIFDYPNERMLDMCRNKSVLDSYGAFDVKVRNISQEPNDEEELYLPLSLSSALSALDGDDESKYVSENNMDFLEETGLIKTYRYNDAFLRPYMVSNCGYDYQTASSGTRTPLRYEVGYRTYLLVTSGSVRIKLTPPKSGKYLYPVNDYENFEFRSPVNPWAVQHQYRPDFDKIKCMEVEVTQGRVIYLPAYWWYSMEFGKDTVVASFKYRTYMNNVAILPRLALSFLQRNNIKRRIANEVSEGSAVPGDEAPEPIETEHTVESSGE